VSIRGGRIILRAHIVPLGAAFASCLVVAAVALGVGATLLTMNGDPTCLDPSAPAGDCAGLEAGLSFDHAWAGRVVALLTALPFVVGVIVGGPMGSTEIENGTASLTWFLEPTRIRWLLQRMIVLGGIVVLMLILPALAGEVLSRGRIPRYDPATTAFVDAGARGALLVVRGLAMFVLAALIGVVVGRVLPTIVIAVGVALLAFLVLDAARWVALPPAEPYASSGDRFVIDIAPSATQPGVYVDREGRLHSIDEIRAMAPVPVDDPAFEAWFLEQGFVQAAWGIDGASLASIPAREVVALMLVIPAGALAAMAVVRNRRPY
jgi:hypothetical protein